MLQSINALKSRESNNNNNIITIDVTSSSLIPPFETIGFLESKWPDILKELVYGNKNILGNFTLYLVMEERRREEYAKEVTSGILDIKPEDNGKEQEEAVNQKQHHHNGSKNNQSWYTRPRDKNGRFTSITATTTTT